MKDLQHLINNHLFLYILMTEEETEDKQYGEG